jgi:hypothetical protein
MPPRVGSVDLQLAGVAGRTLSPSPVLSILGAQSFASFPAIRTAGQVIWCNFDLARQLGFAVPRSNQATTDLHEQLLAALSFRALTSTDGADLDREVEAVTIYADRYGGDGVPPALGAGRGGFLPYGNLYIKGLGFTPLFKHDNPDDFAHSHGEVHFYDCLAEAVFGEVNQNLLAGGSTRVLAIIDQGRHVTTPGGRRIPVALVVRAGMQLRPGHLLGAHWKGGQSRVEQFVQIVRATGQLVTHRDPRTGINEPDLRATMQRVIDDHARTAAESFRWRMIHGAITPSNMEMSGAMLDLPTQSAQSRTAPICALDYGTSIFGREHSERAAHLTPMYRALVRYASQSERKRCNLRGINIARTMDQAYNRHLQLELLRAAGLKLEVAERIRTEHCELSFRFTDVISRLAALRNPGITQAWRTIVETVSVVDVFQLLQRMPAAYFTKPAASLNANIRNYLKPVYRGNRFLVTKNKQLVRGLVPEFSDVYRELMQVCATYAHSYYDNLPGMQASIRARAAFENEPLAALYSRRLHDEFEQAIAAYRLRAEPGIIRAAIDQRISASLRSVDALLAQGGISRLKDGGIEIEKRTIDGINYSVRTWNNARQTRCLRLSIPVERTGRYYKIPAPGIPHLNRRQIQSLRYRFTIDDRRTSSVAKARLQSTEGNGLTINFEIPMPVAVVGRLEGAFFSGTVNLDPGTRFGGYVFAIPDQQELLKLAAGSATE